MDILDTVEAQLPTDIEHAEIKPYFRSQLFSSKIGPNKLVTAGAALFSILGSLTRGEIMLPMNELRDYLVHEINAFETSAESFNYSTQDIYLARYIACMTIDTLIEHAPWADLDEWQAISEYFYTNQGDFDRYFYLIDHFLKNPSANIELLEFTYLCLNLGIDHQIHGQHELSERVNQAIDRLFMHIHHERGEIPCLTNLASNKNGSIKKKSNYWRWIPALALVLLGVYGLSVYFINLERHPVGHELSSVHHSIEKINDSL